MSEQGSTRTDAGRLSVRDAGMAFEGLLSVEEDSETDEAEDGPEQEHARNQDRVRQALKRAGKETSDEDESEDETELEDEQSEDEEEAKDEDESESDEDAPRKRSPQDPEFTLHIEGKDVPVRLSELRNGYLRQSDYTRKTQELATHRKSVEQESEQTRKERAEYGELLPQLRKALEVEAGKEPVFDGKDAQGYLIKRAQWDDHQKQIASIKAEEQRVAVANQQDFERKQKVFFAEQKVKLQEKDPDFRDGKTAKARSKAIADLMRSVGFGEDELGVFDHRALMVLNKAAKYDELMKNSKGLRKQMRTAPVVKPDGQAPRASSVDRNARARLNQTGKLSDAAKVFEGFL